MKNLRPFQIVLLAGFVVIAIVALFMLGNYQASRTEAQLAYGERVLIWGTFDQKIVENVLRNIRQEDEGFAVVDYVEVSEAQFDDQFVNAIAEGRTPDMIMLPAEKLVKHRAKLLAVPYDDYPQRTYRDLYVDGAEIFARQDGIYAIPFAVDPIVMYWNRDLFASNGIAQPPATWEAVVGQVVPATTRRSDDRTVPQSAVAFGEFQNVSYAKEVLLMLAIQSGSALVSETDRGYRVAIDRTNVSDTGSPMSTATQFFTNFSNPNSALYTWNRAKENDQLAFINGNLALYFGRASEAASLARKNPNLNFDVSMVPQGGTATARRTYGSFYGFAFPRASQNVAGAYNAANVIANAVYAEQLTTALDIGPVRRDIIAAGSTNPFRSVSLQSALIARSWLDPAPERSDAIFQQMIEDIVSSRSRINEAVNDLVQRLVLEY